MAILYAVKIVFISIIIQFSGSDKEAIPVSFGW